MVKIYITLAALFFVTLSSGAANAMIQERGTFIPARCGMAEEEMPFQVNVKSVCLGSISGETDPIKGIAALFTMTDGSEALFNLRSTSSQLVSFDSGSTEVLFFLQGPEGQPAKLKVSKAKDGSFQSAIGTLGTTTFFIPSFENVFTAM